MMFQQPARPNGNVHVEFRAGKMEWNGRMVTPDKRKGKIVLMTAEEEQLMHFQWYDREKNELAIDLIVINDAYLEKIEKCTTGRVYLLRFTSSDKKLFFWMQEPKNEKDEEFIKTFNETIGAKIPEKGAAPAAPAAAAGTAAAAAPAPGAAGLPGADQPVDPQLRAILQQWLEQQPAAGPRTPPVPLTAVLTTEVLQGLMSDEDAVKEMSGLLPEGQQTTDDLRDALSSPQLQQSLGGLSQAVHSDQLPVLFASLGLDTSAIATAAPGSDALEVLCRAMEANAPAPPAATEAPAGDAAPPSGDGAPPSS
mmetsp:Transcript_105792/g.183913  ORF Transcript_105792/g.183913 Transcript_105792/m.183913 type:complete len:309 (-) Transcript_105792:79-1005(-)